MFPKNSDIPIYYEKKKQSTSYTKFLLKTHSTTRQSQPATLGKIPLPLKVKSPLGCINLQSSSPPHLHSILRKPYHPRKNLIIPSFSHPPLAKTHHLPSFEFRKLFSSTLPPARSIQPSLRGKAQQQRRFPLSACKNLPRPVHTHLYACTQRTPVCSLVVGSCKIKARPRGCACIYPLHQTPPCRRRLGSIAGVGGGAEVTGSRLPRSNDPHPVQCNGIAAAEPRPPPPPDEWGRKYCARSQANRVVGRCTRYPRASSGTTPLALYDATMCMCVWVRYIADMRLSYMYAAAVVKRVYREGFLKVARAE